MSQVLYWLCRPLWKMVKDWSNIEDGSCFTRSLLYPSLYFSMHPVQSIRWSVGTVNCEAISAIHKLQSLESWETRAVYWAFRPQWQSHKLVFQASVSLRVTRDIGFWCVQLQFQFRNLLPQLGLPQLLEDVVEDDFNLCIAGMCWHFQTNILLHFEVARLLGIFIPQNAPVLLG